MSQSLWIIGTHPPSMGTKPGFRIFYVSLPPVRMENQVEQQGGWIYCCRTKRTYIVNETSMPSKRSGWPDSKASPLKGESPPAGDLEAKPIQTIRFCRRCSL